MTSLLPPNATALEKALEALTGERVGAIGVPLRDLWSAQNCPEDLLPWLAWGLSIDQWDSAWPLNVRRARVAAAIAIQRIKGTAKSVLDVVASFGGQVVVREWFEFDPPATPHTFELTVALGGQGQEAPTADFIDAVIAEVARTKPARSHFDFTVGLNLRSRIGLRAVARPVIAARLSCESPAGEWPAPDWVPEGAIAAFDFKNGRYWRDGIGLVDVDDVLEEAANWGVAWDPATMIVPGVGLTTGVVEASHKYVTPQLTEAAFGQVYNGGWCCVSEIELTGTLIDDGEVIAAVIAQNPGFSQFVSWTPAIFGPSATYGSVHGPGFELNLIPGMDQQRENLAALPNKIAANFDATTGVMLTSLDGAAGMTRTNDVDYSAINQMILGMQIYKSGGGCSSTMKNIVFYPPGKDQAALDALTAAPPPPPPIVLADMENGEYAIGGAARTFAETVTDDGWGTPRGALTAGVGLVYAQGGSYCADQLSAEAFAAVGPEFVAVLTYTCDGPDFSLALQADDHDAYAVGVGATIGTHYGGKISDFAGLSAVYGAQGSAAGRHVLAFRVSQADGLAVSIDGGAVLTAAPVQDLSTLAALGFAAQTGWANACSIQKFEVFAPDAYTGADLPGLSA